MICVKKLNQLRDPSVELMTETTVSSSAKETKYLEKKEPLCNAAASSKVTPTSFKMDLN